MSLKIRAEIHDLFTQFYEFALENMAQDICVFNNITNEDAHKISDFTSQYVVVQKSPLLTDFSFLQKFTCAKYIKIDACKAFINLWDISFNKSLEGIAIIDCGKLKNISTLEYKQDLKHIFINSAIFSAPVLQSLMPIGCQKGLLTLDLAVKKCEDKSKLEFDKLWPIIEAITITPNMRKYFKSQNEV